MLWRVVGASVPGTSHVARDQPCADACAYRSFGLVNGGELLFLVVSDGAGSALKADVGARLACDSLLECAQSWSASGRMLSSFALEDALEWIEHARRQIAALASGSIDVPRGNSDFACTLLAALADDQTAAFLQVGDGAIVRNAGDGLVPVFWPDSGEYANCTYFLTDANVCDHLQFTTAPGVEDIAIFTDGLQSLALQYANRTVHEPFFVPMLKYLRRLGTAETDSVTEALREFLESSAVNERTDDDKTLLLATRRRESDEDSVLGSKAECQDLQSTTTKAED